jgi:PST family polysaccharide transporter
MAQLAGWAATIVTVRFLTPADYGIVGLATIYLSFVAVISEFGLASAIVNLPSLSRAHVAQLNSLSLGLGLAAYAITAALSYLLSLLFRTPELTGVLLSLGFLSVLSGLQTVPTAILQRDMAFRRLTGIEATQALGQGVFTALLAVAGLRYWALVLGALMAHAVGTALLRHARPIGYEKPRIRELGGALTFGRDVLLGRIGWLAYTNADQLIVGRRLGTGALGAYSLALTLSSMPMEKISGLLGRVLPSYLAAVRDDEAAARRYLLLSLEGLSLVTLPLAIGLAVVAGDFVYVVLGERWAPAIFPLQILCVVGAIRSVTVPIAPFLTSRGRADLIRSNSLVAASLLIVAFFIGTWYGLRGVALAWLIVYPFVVTFPLVVTACRFV